MREQPYQYLNGKTGSNVHKAFKANDRSYFALLKKEIHSIAVAAAFSDKKIAEIDIIVAELASNLVKHGGGGDLLVKITGGKDRTGIELISIDNGPGLTDVTRLVLDGVSTKNSLGLGLGAISRLSDVFQVYSLKDWGAVILVRIFNDETSLPKKPSAIDIRSVVIPKPGQELCGDGFYCHVTDESIKLFLGDGLGHGAAAADAVHRAGETFLSCGEDDPVDILRTIDSDVRKTRGLVGTVAVFNRKTMQWRVCGVGNIMTKISGPALNRQYLSYNGIIGLNVPRTLNAQVIEYEKGQTLVLTSDGIKTRWDTLKYTGLARYDLSVMAACLVKDFGRNTDDSSVAACKLNL